MSRYLSSSIAALVFTAVVAASASAGLFHHKRHCEPGCAAEPSCCMPAEPTCCAVEPSCCAPEPTCCAEPVCAAEPSCCVAEPTCCAATACCPTNPCIKYHHKHCHKRKACCSQGTYETVLHVTSPETCCSVCVPVCLPCCCDGCPAESSRCTLLGKGQVRYDYCCGVSVIVRFTKHNNIRVTYCGA